VRYAFLVRRVVIVLLFAGCGYSGLGTGPLDGASDHDGGATFDAAPDPGLDGAVPLVDAAGDAESVEVPCNTGGALCGASGKCFTKCDKHSCPGQEERCFTCLSGPPHAVCGAACGSSGCGCMKSSDCPLPDELCAFGACVRCNGLALGATCQNGEMCRRCDSGPFHCRKSSGKGC
jgi:hypothetical protein